MADVTLSTPAGRRSCAAVYGFPASESGPARQAFGKGRRPKNMVDLKAERESRGPRLQAARLRAQLEAVELERKRRDCAMTALLAERAALESRMEVIGVLLREWGALNDRINAQEAALVESRHQAQEIGRKLSAVVGDSCERLGR